MGVRSDCPHKPRIMVVGSSNTDMVIKTDHLPAPGETVLGGRFVMVAGGKGANQAVAAARLGAAVSLVTRVGMDVFGDTALQNFGREGIDTEFAVRDPEEPSGIALIFVDLSGENAIAVAPGANSRLSPEDVDRARDRMAACSTLVLQLEIPMETVEHVAHLGREKGVRVILNPAPVHPDGLPRSLLESVDVLVPNESEARLLLNLEPDADIEETAARGLLEMGAGSAVVTLGARGALVVTAERLQRVRAPKVTAVDTTAAGDAFTGALAVGLSSGRDLLESADFAAKVAALSVTRIGAQSSLPTADEVARLHEDLWVGDNRK